MKRRTYSGMEAVNNSVMLKKKELHESLVKDWTTKNGRAPITEEDKEAMLLMQDETEQTCLEQMEEILEEYKAGLDTFHDPKYE